MSEHALLGYVGVVLLSQDKTKTHILCRFLFCKVFHPSFVALNLTL